MSGASKDKDSDRKGAKALDYVQTQQRIGAGLEKKTAGAKAKEASRRAQGGDPSHDSPKRHGDKLENARDAAAGGLKGK
jgi:hypothetical protein